LIQKNALDQLKNALYIAPHWELNIKEFDVYIEGVFERKT